LRRKRSRDSRRKRSMHKGRDRSAQFRQDGAGTRSGEDKSEHGQRPQVTSDGPPAISGVDTDGRAQTTPGTHAASARRRRSSGASLGNDADDSNGKQRRPVRPGGARETQSRESFQPSSIRYMSGLPGRSMPHISLAPLDAKSKTCHIPYGA
jgi:hypothetical protein